jgi:hypothetical protein
VINEHSKEHGFPITFLFLDEIERSSVRFRAIRFEGRAMSDDIGLVDGRLLCSPARRNRPQSERYDSDQRLVAS